MRGDKGTSFLRAETRSVLSRNRVELSLVRVGVFGSVIRLQGVLRRVTGQTEMTHECLEALERELRRIPGVHRIEMHLTNWRRQESQWKEIEFSALETELTPQVELDPQALPRSA